MGKIAVYKKKCIGKKAVFLTFIAMIIVAIFVLVYTPQADITLQKDKQGLSNKIYSINDYVNDLNQNYMKTVIKATGSKTLLSLILYMNRTKSYIDVNNFDSLFSEVFINGTINNVQIDSITKADLMRNNTFNNWTARLEEISKEAYNVDTKINVSRIIITQTSPWEVDITLTIGFNVTSNVAKWEENSTDIQASISIEGFPDPYYLANTGDINTGGEYYTKIKRSGVDFEDWNVTHVKDSLRNGTYMHWQNSEAPSFLMRFTNQIQSSPCCGIESFVNPNRLPPSQRDRIESYMDYLFWKHTECTPLYNILFNITNPADSTKGVWDEFRYFKMDANNIGKYNITSEHAIGTGTCQ